MREGGEGEREREGGREGEREGGRNSLGESWQQDCERERESAKVAAKLYISVSKRYVKLGSLSRQNAATSREIRLSLYDISKTSSDYSTVLVVCSELVTRLSLELSSGS